MLGREVIVYPPKERSEDADWAALSESWHDGDDFANRIKLFLNKKGKICNVYLEDGKVYYDVEVPSLGRIITGLKASDFRLNQ
jgi:hypothetical protein